MRHSFIREAIVLSFVLLVAYGATFARFVGPGDSAELTVACSTWGVPHAPGYPLLCLIGNIVVHVVPMHDPAALLNFMNAVFAIAACVLLGFAVHEVTGERAAGFLAGLALGTSRAFWHEALTLEVFALLSLLASGLLLLEGRFTRAIGDERLKDWTLPACVLVATTIVTHHQTLLLVTGPAFVVLVAEAVRRLRAGNAVITKRLVIRSVFALLAGLLPLLYLPIAAQRSPLLNFGDLHGVKGLGALLLRRDFGAGTLQNPVNLVNQILVFGESASPLGWKHYLRFSSDVPHSLGAWLVPFVALGVAFSWRHARAWFWHAVLFLFALVLFLARVNTPMIPLYHALTERFFVLPHLVIAFYAGLGIAMTQRWLRTRRLVHSIFIVGLVILVGPVAVARNARSVDQRDNRFTHDYGHNLLAGVPSRALFFTTGDVSHNALLFQQSIRQRRDVVVVNQDALSTWLWYGEQVDRRGALHLAESGARELPTNSLAWLDRNADASGAKDGRPVVAVRLIENSYEQRYRLLPFSIWSRVMPLHSAVDPFAWRRDSEAIIRNWNVASLGRDYPEASWEGSEQAFYDYALGQLQGLRDVAEVQEPAEGDAFTQVPALEIAKRWTGRRAASWLAYRADFLRMCAEDSTLAITSQARSRLLELALHFTDESLAMDPTQVQAMQTRAAILATRGDSAEQLAVLSRLVGMRPGDPAAFIPYLRLALRRSREGDAAAMQQALAVQARLVRLLEVGQRLDSKTGWERMRSYWSRPLEEIPELNEAAQ